MIAGEDVAQERNGLGGVAMEERVEGEHLELGVGVLLGGVLAVSLVLVLIEVVVGVAVLARSGANFGQVKGGAVAVPAAGFVLGVELEAGGVGEVGLAEPGESVSLPVKGGIGTVAFGVDDLVEGSDGIGPAAVVHGAGACGVGGVFVLGGLGGRGLRLVGCDGC